MMDDFRFVFTGMMVFLLFVVTPWAFIMGFNPGGHFTLSATFPQADELAACQTKLAAEQPVCAPVKCTSEGDGAIFGMFGFLVFILAMAMWIYTQRKLDKREAELNDREKKLSQKEVR